MNILAVDFGTKRMGLAWMQAGLNLVLPYGIIEEGKQGKTRKQQLEQLLKDERIDRVVFGLPIHEDTGEETTNSKRVRSFVDSLACGGVDIVFEDERFTSREADTMEGDASRDEKAAMLILESYRARVDI